MKKRLPSLEELKRLLSYDPETGNLIWIVSHVNNVKVGSIAGTKNAKGYIYIQVNGNLYLAHRVCWYLHYGEDPLTNTVDHINRIKHDNRILNLRLANDSQQALNRDLTSRNTSGHRGVSFRKRSNSWMAYITVNKKRVHLGCFSTKEEAITARLNAEHHYQLNLLCPPSFMGMRPL